MFGLAVNPRVILLAAMAAFAAMALSMSNASAACYVKRIGGMNCSGVTNGSSADFSAGCSQVIVDFQVACKTEYREVTLTMSQANGVCGRGMIQMESGPQGGASCHNDPATALQICKDKGYQGYRDIKQGGYSSPKNNGLITWNGTNYLGYNARTLNNQRIDRITCYGNFETVIPAGH